MEPEQDDALRSHLVAEASHRLLQELLDFWAEGPPSSGNGPQAYRFLTVAAGRGTSRRHRGEGEGFFVPPRFPRPLPPEVIQPLHALHERAEHAFPQLEPPVPEPALLCFGHAFLGEARRLTNSHSTDTYAGEQELHRGIWNGQEVLLCATGVGAPAAAMVAEKLIAAGAKLFVGVGFCGGLRVGTGSCLIPDAVVGEAGVLAAYDIKRPRGDDGLLDGLCASTVAQDLTYHEGLHWTTDAIYRETEEKVSRFRKQGCLGVDMETAGLYVVAQFRNRRAGALLVVTDTLDKKWRPLQRLPTDLLDRAVRAGLTALCP